MADDFADDLPPRRPRARPRGARASGQKQGMSGWKIFGIVALCTVPLLCCIIGLVAMLLPAVQQARVAARKAESMNNLKQIGLAAHNFHAVRDAFPPHMNSGENLGRALDPANPRMSWMTASLPFVDRGALWQQVDPSVPFDDPSVADLYGTRIETYLSPNVTPPEGGLAPAHYAGNVRVLGPEQSGRIDAMTDGAFSTILAGEVDAVNGSPAAWGDPDNLRDPADGLNVPGGFGSNSGGGAIILMADGSVHFLSDTIDPQTMKALATPDGGEPPAGF